MSKLTRVGLRINPFQSATDRLARGPVFGFSQHTELIRQFERYLEPH